MPTVGESYNFWDMLTPKHFIIIELKSSVGVDETVRIEPLRDNFLRPRQKKPSKAHERQISNMCACITFEPNMNNFQILRQLDDAIDRVKFFLTVPVFRFHRCSKLGLS
jgi:hypothetical protein